MSATKPGARTTAGGVPLPVGEPLGAPGGTNQPGLDSAASPAGPGWRRTGSLRAAALTRGPAELLDFVVPLWAGPALGASAAVVGQLVAVELLVSVVARPLAGVLADAFERRNVAAVGAVLYALSCVGWVGATLVSSVALALLAAVLGGLGGSLLWVALRALVAQGHALDGGTFARLLRAEETGAWVAFVGGLSLLTVLGFTGLFVLCGVSCLVGAACLLMLPASAPGLRRRSARQVRSSAAPPPARLRPWLVTIGVLAVGEGAIGIVLLLHLQRGLGFGVVETAYVFLPGAVVMAVLPPTLHRLVVRVGRRAALVGAGLLSATFAVALAFSGSAWTIAAWWLLSGAAWAVVTPLEQAVVAESSPHRLGRAMGAYEAALLLGGAVGAAAAGWSYEHGSWTVVCLGAAGVAVAGTLVGPWALARAGVPDRPGAAVEVAS